jgi:hypothetical protein
MAKAKEKEEKVLQDPNPEPMVEITMKWTKDTKNFTRFDEAVGDDERGHTFYLAKSHYEELGKPKNIVVEVVADYEGR